MMIVSYDGMRRSKFFAIVYLCIALTFSASVFVRAEKFADTFSWGVDEEASRHADLIKSCPLNEVRERVASVRLPNFSTLASGRFWEGDFSRFSSSMAFTFRHFKLPAFSQVTQKTKQTC